MNIGSIQNTAAAQVAKPQSLNSAQKSKLDEIVSKYDGNNFSAQDFESLSKELKDAGIRPSAEVKNALNAKGIDPTKYAGAAGEPQGAPPPGGAGQLQAKQSDDDSGIPSLYTGDSDLSKALTNFYKKLKTDTLSTEDQKNLLSLFDSAGLPPNGVSINKKV
ncbi:MAG: hypothetical protein ACK5WY_04885 [Holosporaceae bacterium]